MTDQTITNNAPATTSAPNAAFESGDNAAFESGDIEATEADFDLRASRADALDTEDGDDETSEADIEAALRAYDPDEEVEDDEDGEDADDNAPAPPIGDLDTEEKVRLMAEAADAVRAEDIQVLDLRPLTIIADYFLICTGKSSIQLRAIADRIEEKLRDNGVRKPRMQGYQEGTWILLDYGDVVAHLMAAEQRAFYSLEEFWEAAPRLELELLPAEARPVRSLSDGFDTLTPVEEEEEEEDEEYEEDAGEEDFEADADDANDKADTKDEKHDSGVKAE